MDPEEKNTENDESTVIENEITLSWNKITSELKKAGYRDGISDAHDSSFQKYFDIGYKEGFQNGFKIGKLKGLLKAKSLINSTTDESNNTDLQYSKKGWCQMCELDDLSNKSIDEIIKHQTAKFNEKLTKLND